MTTPQTPSPQRAADGACPSPEKVAANLQAYVDAGATWVSVIDILPTVLDPEDAPRALPRTLEVCRVLKENAVASAPRAA